MGEEFTADASGALFHVHEVKAGDRPVRLFKMEVTINELFIKSHMFD